MAVTTGAASSPPRPQPGAITEFFWHAIKDHKLLILRCQDCGHFVHYPRPICERCLSTELAPQPVSGRAELYSYTVVMQAFHPYYVDKLPYVLAVVELAEEPDLRLTTNIVDCPEDDLEIGMALEVVFREVVPGLLLPLFRPVGRDPDGPAPGIGPEGAL
jgi:uncharacterized protein